MLFYLLRGAIIKNSKSFEKEKNGNYFASKDWWRKFE
jgi:hypothetical protein